MKEICHLFIRGHGYDYSMREDEFALLFKEKADEYMHSHCVKSKPDCPQVHRTYNDEQCFNCYKEAFRYAYMSLLPVIIDDRVALLIGSKIRDTVEASFFDPQLSFESCVWSFMSSMLGWFHEDSILSEEV